MTRITRIPQLRYCGVFKDFIWPDDLPDFGRYNLIYGWNWTGKTTLSRVLRSLELRKSLKKADAILRIDNSDVRSAEFPISTLHVRVFNRDFISESVFPLGGGDLLPIFIIGKESVEKQKEVEQLKAELEKKKVELDKAATDKKTAERELDNHCVNCAKNIKESLRFSGSAYNNFDKSDYQDRAEQMAMEGNAAAHLLSDQEYNACLAKHRATPKPKILEVTYLLPQFQEQADKVATLLRTTIASAAIEALKCDLELAEWTHQGLLLHKERKSEMCLFCQQPMPESRIKELEAHFNAEYERFLQDIEKQITELEKAEKNIAEVKMPHRAEFYDNLATEFDAAEQVVRRSLEDTRTFMIDLIKALIDKKAQPFKAASLAAQIPTIDVATLSRLNVVIRKHNQACDDLAGHAAEARDRLALAMIAESLTDYMKLRETLNEASSTFKRILEQINKLNDHIMQLEREIREHQRPAEELNEDLKKYLGHGELKLTIKDTGYAVTRNGVPADMLSEGEMTAIALLYFLKSLEDHRFDKARAVIILDDPVSSLDNNALYLAFGYIRERTENAGQLFIFTHNFTFFRQVRNWFYHLKWQKKQDINKRPARFYMLDCVCEKDGRYATIRPLDPLLERYESEYHYLFARIYRAAHQSSPVSLEENYMLPNMARRMLEAFLAFRQPQSSGELCQKVQSLNFDEARKWRLLRFLNTYSHSSAIGEPEHDPAVLAEGASVLKDLLDLIKSEDQAHYQALIELVNPTINSNPDEGKETKT